MNGRKETQMGGCNGEQTRKKQSVLKKLNDDYTCNKVTRGENDSFKEIEGNDININNNLSATL